MNLGERLGAVRSVFSINMCDCVHLDELKVTAAFVILSCQFCRKMEGLRMPRDERRRAQHNEGECVFVDFIYIFLILPVHLVILFGDIHPIWIQSKSLGG